MREDLLLYIAKAFYYFRWNILYNRKNVTKGKHTWGAPQILFFDGKTNLRVGNYAEFASRAMIFLGGEHRLDWLTAYPFTVLSKKHRHIPGHPATKGDVIIGNDTYIGHECIILSGVTIGDGAVVGARAVVTRDVPPYAIVGGNPAKVIRYRFRPETIEKLLKIRWWDWDDEKVDRAIPLLLKGEEAIEDLERLV